MARIPAVAPVIQVTTTRYNVLLHTNKMQSTTALIFSIGRCARMYHAQCCLLAYMIYAAHKCVNSKEDNVAQILIS